MTTFSDVINSLIKLGYEKWAVFLILKKYSKKIKQFSDLVTFNRSSIDFDYSKLQKAIATKKPIEVLVKQISFCKCIINIKNKVFFPRVETEEMVNLIIDKFSSIKNLKILDCCCGTGCIGIALKKNLDSTTIVNCFDINQKCVNLTKENAKLNNVNINCVKHDFFKFFTNNKKKYDIIICNPPYVPLNEVTKKLTKYENKISFNNSKDHLLFYKILFKNIKKTKHMFLEIGDNQKNILQLILKKLKLNCKFAFLKDSYNKYRVLYINNNIHII